MLVSLLPPAALLWPPPLKCSLANSFTEKSPTERKEIFMMPSSRFFFLAVLVVAIFIGCQGPEPRRPVEVKTGSFFKESIERTKKLLAEEEKTIQAIIAKDTANEYVSSPNGFWYYYESKNDTATYLPRTGDQILFSYNLMTLDNDTIYSASDIGPTSHVIDKQQLFPGLQNAVKLYYNCV